MSHLLWKYYWENDVERFRRLLAPNASSSHTAGRSYSMGIAGGASSPSSPVRPASSPRITPKARKSSGFASGTIRFKDGGAGLNRHEVNSRDHAGLTVLLRAASSTHSTARDFVQALLEHHSLDLYVQDPESGWNALHRSLYAGNVSIAQMLLAKERIDITNHVNQSAIGKVGQLIKTKDHEGNSPFDVYNSTIATRSLKEANIAGVKSDESDFEDSDGEAVQAADSIVSGDAHLVQGNEFYMFGSNKNITLGVGDEDDRQYPERVLLQRPSGLLHQFHLMSLRGHRTDPSSFTALEDIPTLVRNPALTIRDVVMSKLHTAVVTNDPQSNLYVCGVGRGGRLGLGDENTQFRFVPVEGPLADRKINQVALGQNHSMAVTDEGELWTWGLNSDSQLGYALPPVMRSDEEPMSLSPRQVFGPLKKECVLGIAASAAHSVAHTGSSLFCWGRNLGQLALMDADSRSLEIQPIPRKVAASLLAASIEMVSAVEKATTCLLSNFTVWVFTNYGYNLVKFPFPDVFSNHGLTASFATHKNDKGRRSIRSITSGGETIAAVTARGDLFTMQLNNKLDANQVAGSTTNPVKIKSAVTQPQCIWESRKDGVVSVSVGEHGSVIICTESGAVWKRVKRAKGKKASYSGSSDARKRDFKFERVPYVTNCIAVRSSTFGAFAAIRKDSRIMSTEIKIRDQSIWDDIGSLLCIKDFKATRGQKDDTSFQKGWDAAIAREGPGSLPHEILWSSNIEKDLAQWLSTHSFQFGDLNMEIRTSLNPEVRIPVHTWLLAARSPVVRQAQSEPDLVDCARTHTGAFVMEKAANTNRILLTFSDIDILTLLNVVVYAYLDAIIPVWRYTREAPSRAGRFRQVRTELMRLGTKLQMPQLETAARLQTVLSPSLDVNLREAVEDPVFFQDADMLIELDGDEVFAHCDVMCRRCPFFETLFRGRSQGQWVAGRRDASPETQLVSVNLKHISCETFQYVMKFLYADMGEEMFNDVCLATLDHFSDLVIDVLSAANELMLDRLSQVCQCVLGKFVTTRNIANLLNEVSPCSITEFKDVGLEYICLQLESMLENHLLDGLDEEVLLELDEVVRNNQLACFPWVRSRGPDQRLHQKYPDLMLDIEEERRRRVRAMAFKIMQKDQERRPSLSYKARVGSFDEALTATQTHDRPRLGSEAVRNAPFSPILQPKETHTDLIFDMDDDSPKTAAPISPGLPDALGSRNGIGSDELPQLLGNQPPADTVVSEEDPGQPQPLERTPPSRLPESNVVSPLGAPIRQRSVPRASNASTAPWASRSMPPASKLDLKDIMQEASHKSALTAGLSKQAEKAPGPNKPQARLSQKERKKLQVLQGLAEAAAEKEKENVTASESTLSAARPAPWKAIALAPKAPQTSMQWKTAKREGSVLSTQASTAAGTSAQAQAQDRMAASPDTRFSGQGRVGSSPAVLVAAVSRSEEKRPLIPHSKLYIQPAPKTEALTGTGLADIIGQQQLEQQRVKESVAKRSLQEIQEEQAFQEWWDQESRRTQDEEARRVARLKDREQGNGGRRGRKGKGGKPKPNSESFEEPSREPGSHQASSRARKR